ncbi:MAG: DUF1552 domain-containing protein [Pirellulaceae bacterium]|nr:DUF1552 domain-containing protein [Pirellulaceae bacterium]
MMSKCRVEITRRTLLRGAGVTLALPWLEAMVPSVVRGAAAQASPIRMAALFMPNGVRADQWTPEGQGTEFQLSPTLEPLADLKKELLVLTNLWNQASDFGDGHYVKTSGFLTCTTINKSLGIDLNCNGVSMDQLAARTVADATPLPSLELATEPISIGVDRNVGYTRVYGSHVAWKGPTNPLAREINPQLVYERLFRAGLPQTVNAQRDRQLLDLVLGDASDLRQRLGVADRQRIDEYLQSVRSLEQRLERASGDSASEWSPLVPFAKTPQPTTGIPSQYQEHVRLMLDMIALAFQTDTTRVCTFMFGNAVSGRNFSFLEGVQGGHHQLSHHQNKEEMLRQYQVISRWHVQQYAYLLNKLRQMPEHDGSVLDNSMILFGSGLRDGNGHNPHNLPILLAGRAQGRLAVGKHLVFGNDTPLANLYVSMLNAFGAEVERFADSTGPLAGVWNSSA